MLQQFVVLWETPETFVSGIYAQDVLRVPSVLLLLVKLKGITLRFAVFSHNLDTIHA